MNDTNSVKIIPKQELANDPFSKISFSQFGEDLLLEVLFKNIEDGFYVDIGAHHPRRISNTYLLHQRGWSGINVDLDPKHISNFLIERPNDRSIVAAVSDRMENVKIRLFNEGAVNTISDEAVALYKNHWQIVEEKDVMSTTLADIFREFLPTDSRVNFLNVDVEGVDLKVLKGNDWNTYRPDVVLVEVHGLELLRCSENMIVTYMTNMNYKFIAYGHNAAFFVRE